jgi:signal transduction histidine kinase
MKTLQISQHLHFPRLKKRRLSLRLRLALWSAALVFVLSFCLLLFINTIAISDFPRIVRANAAASPDKRITALAKDRPVIRLYPFPPSIVRDLFPRPLNPLELSLLYELQSISLMGLALVTVLGGAGAYWLAGIALRPVRKVSKAAQQISAKTLDTRLALVGPRDEVKELADTFDAMLERLQYTFALQERFVADVAHELRTPLASLRTNLEVVAADTNASLDDYRAMALTQERALTRLERLVADLLILATSQQPLLSQEVSLGSLLEEVMADLQPVAAKQDVTLRLVDEADVVVRGDGSLLGRVFSNLIENGIRYNHPGGTVTVTVNNDDTKPGHPQGDAPTMPPFAHGRDIPLQVSCSWAVITIVDTGVGIPSADIPHIFGRFYRVDASRTRHNGGAGLGLSIVSAIVQQHGGQVQAASTPGQGSVFTVLLPVASA